MKNLATWRHAKEINVKSVLRIRFMFWVLVLCFFGVLLRLVQLQIIQADKLTELATKKNQNLKSIPIQKGDIITADNQLLASSLPVDSVFADPSKIKNKYMLSELLANILKLPQEQVFKALQTDTKFVWLKRSIDKNTKAIIQELNLSGVGFKQEFKRIYPAQSYLASILGFSNVDSDGLEGLEYVYNDQLYLDAPASNINPAITGSTIKLTIEDVIQHIAEKRLQEFVTNMQATSGLVIILESESANILAAANYPTYNPNIYNLYEQNNVLNPFVGSIYEPGSTFKLITIASALELGIIEDDASFNCGNGSYKINTKTIKDSTPLGQATLFDIIRKSSNICAAKIGLSIPKEQFYNMIAKFNFLNKTKAGMLGEVSSLLQSPKRWRQFDQAALSFGHGIGVTPLQLISSINVFANDGNYIYPNLIKEITNEAGIITHRSKIKSFPVIKPENAAIIKKYMRAVIRKGGTGYYASLKEVDIAGKTGTTQLYDSETNKYSQENHLFSFAGFFPADDPKYTILTIINNPQKSYRGTETATILFREIARQIVKLKQPPAKQNIKIAFDN